MDGKTYPASGLVKRILSQYVHDVDTLPGPRYWKLPDGDTLSYLASTLNGHLQEDQMEP